ncbi:MAG: gliding motility-associated C-terminal domain-containing protein [Saprospiraceae bacterium]|nr:gliding motility-associated C-terminal domain-containing protein [Saprospiraceae bacterium]
MNISLIKNKISHDTLRLCRGDTLIYNGQPITTQTDIQKNLTSAELCDSLVYVHVRMLEPVKTSHEVKLCPGDSLYIAGNWINTEGKVEEIYLGSNGCDSTAITNIRLIAEPEEPKMEIDCESGEINLSISATDDWQIQWDNGSNSEQTTYKDKPDAKVRLTAIEGCERQFTITLPQIPNITLIKQPNDTIINSTETLKIDLGLDLSEWKIVWTPNGVLDCDTCSQVNITIDQNTEFVINLKHTSGCDYQIKFRVNIEKSKLNIPNIFSPDGDGHNDNWEIKLPPGIEILQCSIYDRWGERIYSRSGTIHWDGTFKGKKVMSGVYVYVIEYIENGEKMFITGDVTLVR